MPAPAGRPMTVRTGDRVWVRPIEPGDASELRRAYEQLSEQSRYRRFFTGMPTLSDSLLRTLTEVDHVDREALVALPSEDSETIVGVVRFVRDRYDSTTADLAITVADEWQGRGLATGLLELLGRRASEVGIAHFTVDMLAENRAVLALVRSAGGVPVADTGTTLTSQIDIGDDEEGVDLVSWDVAAVLRAVARGDVLAHPRQVREIGRDAGSVPRAPLLPGTATLGVPRSAGGAGPPRDGNCGDP
jgi:RimJ/RimL family protein N-acetyltransferase